MYCHTSVIPAPADIRVSIDRYSDHTVRTIDMRDVATLHVSSRGVLDALAAAIAELRVDMDAEEGVVRGDFPDDCPRCWATDRKEAADALAVQAEQEDPRFFRAPCVHCGDTGHVAWFHSPAMQTAVPA